MRRWKGGDRVHVRMAGERRSWVRGRVLRAPHVLREGTAVTVDCDDGVRRFVEPARLTPELVLVKGGRE